MGNLQLLELVWTRFKTFRCVEGKKIDEYKQTDCGRRVQAKTNCVLWLYD